MTTSGTLRTMDDLSLDGKTVLVRVDFNVNVGDDETVDATEDYRIEAALPTIEELTQRRCRVLLITHRGRPQENPRESDLTPMHRRLEYMLREEVQQISSLKPEAVRAATSGAGPGSVLLLPNIRIDDREEAGSKQFATELAGLGDVFVNEAFSVSHRNHASVAGVARELPSCAGRRTVREVEALQKLRDHPDHPYVVLLSGAKIHTKVGMIRDLLGRVEYICIGGQIGNVFLAAQGYEPRDQFSSEEVEVARQLITEAGDKLLLPVDVLVGNDDGTEVQNVVIANNEMPSGATCSYDIGPKTVELFLERCRGAKTIMWNGPMGRFEIPAYAEATKQLAHGLAELSAYRVVGGGDTVKVIEEEKLLARYDHISVGGGAMVAFLEGTVLPGLEPLYSE